MANLRAALVGLGSMGRNHARNLRALPDVDFVAAVDPQGDAYGVAGDVPGLADLDELIDAPDEQVLRFNPAHRRGELPGQKLDEEDAGELACGSVVHRDSGEAL